MLFKLESRSKSEFNLEMPKAERGEDRLACMRGNGACGDGHGCGRGCETWSGSSSCRGRDPFRQIGLHGRRRRGSGRSTSLRGRGSGKILKSVSNGRQDDIHSITYPTDPGAVEAPDSIFGVSRVLKLDESKTWRIPGHPDVFQGSILSEAILQLILVGIVAEITDVYLAVNVPVTVARHSGVLSVLEAVINEAA